MDQYPIQGGRWGGGGGRGTDDFWLGMYDKKFETPTAFQAKQLITLHFTPVA